jgi:hypothetical protein
LCKFRTYLQGGKVQISPVGGSGRTLSCVSASLRVAEQISDNEMIFKVTSKDFAENALYHAAFII